MNTVVGVSLSGVVFLTAESLEGVDPFFPKLYGTLTDINKAKEGYD